MIHLATPRKDMLKKDIDEATLQSVLHDIVMCITDHGGVILESGTRESAALIKLYARQTDKLAAATIAAEKGRAH